MEEFRFHFIALRYDANKNSIEEYNIFDNHYVNEYSIKYVKKYLRSPKKFEYRPLPLKGRLVGFKALVSRIRDIVRSELWARFEYEMYCTGMFNCSMSRMDCYEQFALNIEANVREMLYQYREYKKSIRPTCRHPKGASHD